VAASSLALYYLLMRLSLSVRCLGMIVGCFGMATSLRRFLMRLGVLAFAMM
jgi:hypothetical protein